MLTYTAPWRDMHFVIEELLALPRQWAAMPAFESVDAELARQVIGEAGRFASEVLLPVDAPGDLEGCHLNDGAVTTPRGYRAAYAAFVDAGWPALACTADSGGQGLPQLLNTALYEMLAACGHAWSMYPGLLHGAYECLHRHGSPALRERYLGKLVSGEWLATMCLTEAQAGSDLGLVATRAVARADGSHAISGSKIFISGGDHDLTDNIVHLVLARLPDAPAGTRGLSLFLVPKRLPGADGEALGARNAVVCDSIEHKLGIRGSATCVMRFDAATGWLVGEPNRGLAAMFAMMNASRLHVGLQGLGHAEIALQNALAYARERVQSRAVDAEGAGPHPIVEHAAVRRVLLALRARVEGGRMLAYRAAHAIDLAEHSADADTAARERTLAALLTPLAKAVLTEYGFACASDALQLWGGHGYVHESGIEKTLRDARISMIYEGTNEIQAIDLLVRKGVADAGRGLGLLFDELEATLPAQALHAPAVRRAIGAMREALLAIIEGAAGDAELPYRVAPDWMSALGIVVYAHGFACADAVAAQALAAGSGDAAFYGAKRETAAYWMRFMLPELDARLRCIEAGSFALPRFDAR